MSPTDRPYTLTEIASIAGVTPRTVRYYVAQGLLPSPGEGGRGPHYDDTHLARLRLVRELQKRHLPLAEIRRRLTAMSDAEVTVALEAKGEADQTERPASSALDYIRAVLGEGSQVGEAPVVDAASATFATGLAMPSMPSIGREEPGEPTASGAPTGSIPTPGALLKRTDLGFRTDARPPADAAPTSERSQWDRIALTPDIELHVRRPLGRLDNRRVERLISIARQILKEETK